MSRQLSMVHRSVVLASVLFLFAFLSAAQAQRLQDDSQVNKKIEDIIKQLTLEEKIAMLHANGLFSSGGVPRLHIPDLISDDGPLGVREDVLPGWGSANLTTDSATFFPNGSALAATWNPELAYRYGHDLAEEARARAKHIILAPAVNITRTPLNGRTYEYLSEDPYLNTKLAVPAIKAIQSQHVAACVKHYAVNNQEVERGRVDVQIDERALQEIYLPAFKASILDANAWTIMSAYNKLRGEYCSENQYLLNTILKGEWGFKGTVISDWGGTHSTVDAAVKGLDIEMGSGEKYNEYFFADALLEAVKQGKVSAAIIDEKVKRVLWVMHQTSLNEFQSPGKINTPEHTKTAYDIAAESIVLLKNDRKLLPLNMTRLKSVAIIGDNATHEFHLGGFGAGVKARYEVTPLEGLSAKLPKSVKINYAQGYSGVYKPKGDILVNTDTHPADAKMIGEAVAVAKNSEMVLLFVGGNRDYESESRDRKDLSLPFGEQQLVDEVTKANPNTIVVFVGGAPYDLSKIKKDNHTIVWSWYNGSENGNALADVLLGKVNPSGKLPFTIPATLAQSPAHAEGAEVYPGVDLKVNYKEGILVGYRWYDTKKIEPLYPFGYGLSYTNYAYSDIRTDAPEYTVADSITITLKVKNAGKVAGKETVQFYISKNSSKIQRAEKDLKAFQKVLIKAGEVQNIQVKVAVNDLSYFDTADMKWKVEPGAYTIHVGASSRDIKLTSKIAIR